VVSERWRRKGKEEGGRRREEYPNFPDLEKKTVNAWEARVMCPLNQRYVHEPLVQNNMKEE
jgi:hypothetical protein